MRFQQVDLTFDEVSGLAALVSGLKGLGQFPEESRPFAPEAEPYPGLKPFRPDQEAIFVGRAEEVARLVRLIAQRKGGIFLAVSGPSGVRKTSMVQAGLIPRLAGSAERWFILTWRVLPRAAETFVRSLHEADVEVSVEGLRSDPASIADAMLATSASVDAGATLLVIEQAEQLLLDGSGDDRAAIVGAISSARDRGATVVATLRSEYLAHPNATRVVERIRRTRACRSPEAISPS